MLKLLALPLAAAAALALAGPASANTYCVAAPGCSGTSVGGGVQGALNAAKSHGGADTVQIGAGSFTSNGLGFRYDDPSPANPVTVAGAGAGKTTLTTSSHDSTTVLGLAAGSVARDLHFGVPGGFAMHGLGLDGATGRNVTVDGDASAGAVLSGAATLRGSKVAGNVGIDVFGGGSTVLNTTATGRASAKRPCLIKAVD